MKARSKVDKLVEITNNQANNNDLSLQNDYYIRKMSYVTLNDDIIKKIYEDLQNNKINAKNIEAMATLQKINIALLNDRPIWAGGEINESEFGFIAIYKRKFR